MLLDAGHTPSSEEIENYISEPARALWRDMNIFIQEHYKVSPKTTYSKCAAKPGWNVKYAKSGKSICTLYPEENSFTALVVITLDLEPVIDSMSSGLEPGVVELIRSARPFSGTKWLMITVTNKAVLSNVKQLLLLKYEMRKKRPV